jgi:hypothetical protein
VVNIKMHLHTGMVAKLHAFFSQHETLFYKYQEESARRVNIVQNTCNELSDVTTYAGAPEGGSGPRGKTN